MKKIVFFLILLSTVSLNTFAQTKDEKDVDNTKDPVTSLREQIEGAGTACRPNSLATQTRRPPRQHRTQVTRRLRN